jgi:uncharacterized protein (DUF2461 family)
VKSAVFRKKFGSLEGEKLSRVPLGFPKDHPAVQWLRHKGFYAGVRWPESSCLSARFTAEIMQVYTTIAPLVNFLNSALKPALRRP